MSGDEHGVTDAVSLDQLQGLGKEVDVDERTDPTSLADSRESKRKADLARTRETNYIRFRLIWAVTLYIVFVVLVIIEIVFIATITSGHIAINDDSKGLFYTSAWLGFVAQIISLVVVAVKHYFPQERE